MREDGFSGIVSKSGDDERYYNASEQGRDDPLGRYSFPFSRPSSEGIFVLRPIVQHRWIKVSAVRPHLRFHLLINDHLIEHLKIQ